MTFQWDASPLQNVAGSNSEQLANQALYNLAGSNSGQLANQSLYNLAPKNAYGLTNVSADLAKTLHPLGGAGNPEYPTENYYGAPAQTNALGMAADGKIVYGMPSDRIYSGNDRRESYLGQGWVNPDWVKQQSQAGKLSLYDLGGGKQGYAADQSIVNDPNFAYAGTGQNYRNNADLNGSFLDKVWKTAADATMMTSKVLSPEVSFINRHVFGRSDAQQTKDLQTAAPIAASLAAAYFGGGLLGGSGSGAGAGASTLGTTAGTTAADAAIAGAATGGTAANSLFTLNNALSAYNVASGIKTHNVGQALGGALGFGGAGGVGAGLTNKIGAGLSGLGVSSSLTPYLANGILNASTTALSGGNFRQSLTNGLAAGAGAYGGQQVGNFFNGNVPKFVTDALAQGTAGALGTAIRGGNVGQGALYSGLNGLAGGLGKSLAKTDGLNQWQSSLAGGVPQAALNLYRIQQRKRG